MKYYLQGKSNFKESEFLIWNHGGQKSVWHFSVLKEKIANHEFKVYIHTLHELKPNRDILRQKKTKGILCYQNYS